jgi:molecular chaperone Hsp33
VFGVSHRDSLVPFMVGAGAVRGRLVRLGPALDHVLSDYPLPVAKRLAEVITLCAGLAGALKFEGVFTLQIQGDGPIPLVVADVTSSGDLRAYARYQADRLPESDHDAGSASIVKRYFGSGHLALTVDQGPDTDRYQGIVELTGATLADSARKYFVQSEQLDTEIVLTAQPPSGDEGWHAALAVVQRMPQGPRSPILTAEEAEETWNRAGILLRSVRNSELLDWNLTPEQLLWRLYHDDGLTIQPPRPLQAHCRCSLERVSRTLAAFPRVEIESLTDEVGEVVVTCEFCGSRYVFTQSDLDDLYSATIAPLQ